MRSRALPLPLASNPNGVPPRCYFFTLLLRLIRSRAALPETAVMVKLLPVSGGVAQFG